jgi:hypothetical protein
MPQDRDDRTNPVHIALVGEANPAVIAHRASRWLWTVPPARLDE